jgi:hypothetical protein
MGYCSFGHPLDGPFWLGCQPTGETGEGLAPWCEGGSADDQAGQGSGLEQGSGVWSSLRRNRAQRAHH